MMKYFFLIGLICICNFQDVFARKIYSKNYKFRITIPDEMLELKRDMDTAMELAYYDTTTCLILTISAQEGKFTSVKDYLDCTRDELERQLKNNFEDSTLRLVSCSKSAYYPKETTKLHFEVRYSATGNNIYQVYFIHYQHNDLQLSFNYKKETEQTSLKYIDTVMKTLRLKRVL